MDVPLVNLAAQCAPIDAEIKRAVLEVIDTQRFILGPVVETFEAEAARYLGVEHSIGCASGSDALYLALRALGVGRGDQVVTVPLTYIATAEAIARVGAEIVFCDVDPVTWTLDPGQLGDLLSERTAAILPVHLYGQCADMDAIRAVAGDVAIVEDVAQAWGARYRGRLAGTLGTLGCFSFFPTKPLGGFGDGGLVATSDADLAVILRRLRAHGESERYRNVMRGVNSRLDAIQAAVLRTKLRHVDRWNEGRRRVVEYYRARFEGTAVAMPRVGPENLHVWHQCVIRTPHRDALMAHLRSLGIGCAVYYPLPLHLQPCHGDLGHRPGDFPVAEDVCHHGLAIPCWPEMTDSQRARVADEILTFVQRSRALE